MRTDKQLAGDAAESLAIALIERDGRMMAVAWALGLVEIVVVATFSGQIAGWIARLLS